MDEFGNIEIGIEILDAESDAILPKMRTLDVVYVYASTDTLAPNDTIALEAQEAEVPSGYGLAGIIAAVNTTTAYDASTETNKANINSYKELPADGFDATLWLLTEDIPETLTGRMLATQSNSKLKFIEVTVTYLLAPAGNPVTIPVDE